MAQPNPLLSSTGHKRSRQQSSCQRRRRERQRRLGAGAYWNRELSELLSGIPDDLSADFFLDASSSDENAEFDQEVESAMSKEAAEATAQKLKELQSQLVAMAIENEALKARVEQREAELTERLRQQLLPPTDESATVAGQQEQLETAAVGGLSWTGGTMARIPRALARLRRRHTAATVAAGTIASAPAGDALEASGLSKREEEEADDEGADDAESSMAQPPEAGGLASRAINWMVASWLCVLEDMQAPTDAERLLTSAAEEQQLSARKLKVNCSRFGRNSQPVFACIDGFINVVRWRSPSYTALVMLMYYFALLNSCLLPLLLMLCIARLLLNYFKYRLNWGIDFNFLADYEPVDADENSDKERTVSTQVNFVVHVARKVQNLTGNISDNMEKFKNLVTWRSPQHTQLLLNALLVAFILSLLVQTSTYLFYCGLYIGIKFFIVDTIFSKYPRLRLKYDSVDRIWRSLPTDQQMGYHQTNKDVEKYILPFSDEDPAGGGESRPDKSSPLDSDDEEFCQVFALPNMERPLARWKGGKRCAIICKEADRALPDSLKHGKLFLTRSFICFERGKDRGKAKKRNIVIPLTMIRWVKKTKPFGWLPGGGMAIEVLIRGMEKGITFGAIIGRDELFDSLTEAGRRAALPWATRVREATTAAAAAATDESGGCRADEQQQQQQLLPPDSDLVQSVCQALLSDSEAED